MCDLSSLTRDPTHIPCIGRWILNHGTPGKSLSGTPNWGALSCAPVKLFVNQHTGSVPGHGTLWLSRGGCMCKERLLSYLHSSLWWTDVGWGMLGEVKLSGRLHILAHQAPLSMGFFRHEYRSGLPCPPPGDLPNSGIEPASLTSPALAGRFFTTSTTWEALNLVITVVKITIFIWKRRFKLDSRDWAEQNQKETLNLSCDLM